MDARVKPGHDAERAILNKRSRIRFAKTLRRFRARMSDSPVKQPAGKTSKLRRPCCSRRGVRRHGFPFAGCEGTSPLSKCEGAERREARGNILTPCGVRPVTLG